MAQSFQAFQISESIYHVGVVDWALRNFHGYETRRGTTYNAFLVRCPKGYVLIDTVRKGFEEELLSRIRSVCDPHEIVAVISNHAEMDHSGCLVRMLSEIAPDAPVYASPMGVKALVQHYKDAFKPIAVHPGTSLEIAGRVFQFVETRMLHWPDSMWTYDETDRVLFTNDAFGMHLACHPCWSDEWDTAILEEEGSKYFANILEPYAPLVSKLCCKYCTLGICPVAVCPDHGPCWRGEGIGYIFERYSHWSDPAQHPDKALVVYDTMWHSTETMARAIGEGIRSKGIICELMPLSGTHRSDVARALLKAKALIVGTPTLNSGMLPSIADVLCYLKGLKFPIELGAAFGSYGWAPLGTKAVNETLTPMCKNMAEILNIQYIPSDDDLVKCREYGASIADQLNNK